MWNGLSAALSILRSRVGLVRAHGGTQCPGEVVLKIGSFITVGGVWGAKYKHPVVKDGFLV